MNDHPLGSWPEDADGGVFRRLASSGFEFDVPHTLDYNVDFASWPPPEAAIAALSSKFGTLTVYKPHGSSAGYVLFQEIGLVSYPRVMEVQRVATEAVAEFGGICESWGVMRPAAH
jgi:hypothetical protein